MESEGSATPFREERALVGPGKVPKEDKDTRALQEGGLLSTLEQKVKQSVTTCVSKLEFRVPRKCW